MLLRLVRAAPCAAIIILGALGSSSNARAEEPVVPAPPAPTPSAPSGPSADEVTVRGSQSTAKQLQESADAVTVVDTRKAQEQTVDLGEVLARTQGVGVRRDGGLGSNATLSLNGLQGDQIRLFVDGVPIQLAGFPFGVVNVPVNLVERMEVYRGVVPIRLGSDALGGAINLVTDPRYDTHVGASWQTGSFGTVRTTVNGTYRHESTGFVVRIAGFLDSARNNFWMDDRAFALPDGTSVYRSFRRFNDAYHARGGSVEVGVVDRPWARQLLLQGVRRDVRQGAPAQLLHDDTVRRDLVRREYVRVRRPLQRSALEERRARGAHELRAPRHRLS